MEEQLQQCVYCAKDLPPKGYFCPRCGKQNRCRSCNEGLEKDANACIYCGTSVGANGQSSGGNIGQPIVGSQPVMNEIEYHETKSSRSARAKFTDTVGNSVSNALVGFIGKGFNTNRLPSKFEKEPLVEDGSAQVIDIPSDEESEGEISLPLLAAETVPNQLPTSAELEKIGFIFQFGEDQIILAEPRLKASNKIEYVKRMTVLLAYANHLRGITYITRKDLNKLLAKYDLNYGGSRSWLASGELLHVDDATKTLQLNRPGLEMAPRYLQDVFDTELKDGFQPSKAPAKRKKKKQDATNSETDFAEESHHDNDE